MSGPSASSFNLRLVIPQSHVMLEGNSKVYTPAKSVSMSNLYELTTDTLLIDEAATAQAIVGPIAKLVRSLTLSISEKQSFLDQINKIQTKVEGACATRRTHLLKFKPLESESTPEFYELSAKKVHRLFQSSLKFIFDDHKKLIEKMITALQTSLQATADRETETVLEIPKENSNLKMLRESLAEIEKVKSNLFTTPLYPNQLTFQESHTLTTFNSQEFEKFTRQIALQAPEIFFMNIDEMYRPETNFKARTAISICTLLESFPIHPDVLSEISESYFAMTRLMLEKFESHPKLQNGFSHASDICEFLKILERFNDVNYTINVSQFVETAKTALNIKTDSFFDTFKEKIDQMITDGKTIEDINILCKWMTIVTLICLSDVYVRDIVTSQSGQQQLLTLMNGNSFTLMHESALILRRLRTDNKSTHETNVHLSEAKLFRSNAFRAKLMIPQTPRSTTTSFIFEDPQ